MQSLKYLSKYEITWKFNHTIAAWVKNETVETCLPYDLQHDV